MSPFTIVVDTSCDLPAAFIRENHIEMTRDEYEGKFYK